MSTAEQHVSMQARRASEEDWKFCATMLPKVSRTFALSIGALPPELREAIRIAYLLCRTVDTIEDDAVVVGETRERLYDMFDLLMTDDGADPTILERLTEEHALGAGTDDHKLCLNAGAVFRCYRELSAEQRVAIRPHVLEMSRGMREFTRRADRQGRLRLENLDELERYCYFVAGTVGKLLTALFEDHVGPLPQHLLTPIRARSVSFGLALQLVNIVKDVAEDLPRGDCFLPEDIARGEGVALDAILEPENRSAGMAIIARVCDRARDHLKRAEQYTLLWPTETASDVRMFCTVPLVLALATLHEVEDGGDTLVPGKTPKITRKAVGDIFADARIAIQRNDTLRWMIGYYASGAYLDADALPAPAKERVSTMPPPAVTLPEVKPLAEASPSPRSERQTSVPEEQARLSLVTGASGMLGANLVRRLLDSGKRVRVLLRQGSNNQAMDGLRVERIYGDVTDASSVHEFVKGCDAIFHCATSADAGPLLGAARREGVRRVVCIDRLGISDHERACDRAVADGLDVVRLSTAELVGANDHRLSGLTDTLVRFAKGRVRAFVPGGLEVAAVDDVVAAALQAMDLGQSGHHYPIASEFYTTDELIELFEETTGVPRPRMKLPRRVRVATNMIPRAFRHRMLDTGDGARADTTKARQELGFLPTTVKEAVVGAYDDLAQRGLVAPRMTIVDGSDVAPTPRSSQAKRAGAAA